MISSHLSCGFLISYPGKRLGLARCGRLPEACSWANPLCSSDGVRPFGGNARTCRNGYAPPVGLFVVETPFYVRDVAGLIPCLQKKCRTLSRNLRQNSKILWRNYFFSAAEFFCSAAVSWSSTAKSPEFVRYTVSLPADWFGPPTLNK